MINKIQQQKKKLRKQIRLKLAKFNSVRKQNADDHIQNCLYSLDSYSNSKVICIYVSTEEEVETREIIRKELFLNSRSVVVPKIRDGILKLYKISKWSDLKSGKYGIEEPKNGLPEIEIAKIDILVVPGIAFDKNCNRLGRGGGYYDKALQNVNAIKIGLGYDFQILPKIPHEKYDVRLNYIITEKGVIKMV